MLCWVPSRVLIVGNEQADRASKSAVVPITISIPVEDLRKRLKMLLHSKRQGQWDSETNTKLHIVKPVVQQWLSLTNKKANVPVTHLRIGHTRFIPLVAWRGTTNALAM
ncbi:hypothetical protein AVEN_242432-1 [Araneus ventricosus]|uniref:Uncharacterized protein n=1 Tax=Araneus ventricosus TaxID=182803 RepID=A0A4Y2LES6_ARAVE|nr:hypothetical protein AVEN_242432-1 [Araneus ventricosus]